MKSEPGFVPHSLAHALGNSLCTPEQHFHVHCVMFGEELWCAYLVPLYASLRHFVWCLCFAQRERKWTLVAGGKRLRAAATRAQRRIFNRLCKSVLLLPTRTVKDGKRKKRVLVEAQSN